MRQRPLAQLAKTAIVAVLSPSLSLSSTDQDFCLPHKPSTGPRSPERAGMSAKGNRPRNSDAAHGQRTPHACVPKPSPAITEIPVAAMKSVYYPARQDIHAGRNGTKAGSAKAERSSCPGARLRGADSPPPFTEAATPSPSGRRES